MELSVLNQLMGFDRDLFLFLFVCLEWCISEGYRFIFVESSISRMVIILTPLLVIHGILIVRCLAYVSSIFVHPFMLFLAQLDLISRCLQQLSGLLVGMRCSSFLTQLIFLLGCNLCSRWMTCLPLLLGTRMSCNGLVLSGLIFQVSLLATLLVLAVTWYLTCHFCKGCWQSKLRYSCWWRVVVQSSHSDGQ